LSQPAVNCDNIIFIMLLFTLKILQRQKFSHPLEFVSGFTQPGFNPKLKEIWTIRTQCRAYI